MMHATLTCLLIALAAASGSAHAASVIEVQENSEDVSLITIDGTRMRMQPVNAPTTYNLVDVGERRQYAVNLRDKTVVDMRPSTAMNGPMSLERPRPKAHVELVDKGMGPLIAGYLTRHYRLLADGETCADVYFSRRAMEATGMRPFLLGFAAFFLEQKAAMLAMQADFAPCEDAEQVLQERAPQLGLMMKSVYADGRERLRVRRIQRSAAILPGTFVIPSDFKTVSLEELSRDRMDDDPALQEWLRSREQEAAPSTR